MKQILAPAAMALAFVAIPAAAEDHHAGMHHAAASPAKSAALSEGTIKKMDKAAGKLTIAHGPLENLGMPPMTMSFKVKEAAMMAKVKVGDKVRFRVEESKGDYLVTHLEPAK